MPSRKPDCKVLLNGIAAPGLLEAVVDNNSYAQADTFNVGFSVQRLLEADWSSLGATGLDAFIKADTIYVQVFFTDDVDATPDLPQFIAGRVDDVHYDPVANVIHFSGRDYTGFFIDAKTTKKYANQLLSSVIKELAGNHGMNAVVTLAKDQKVGAYLADYQAQMNDVRSEWDLLLFLASHTVDGNGNPYLVYVSGDTLYFVPRPVATSYTIACQPGPPFTILDTPSGASGGIDLRLSRNLTVARDLTVIMHVANAGEKPYTVSYPPNRAKGIAAGLAKSNVTIITLPNASGLTREQAQQRVQQVQRERSLHEVKLNARLPSDLLLMPTSVIEITGTGTAFDQTYYPDSVQRTFSVDEGFVMDIQGKNIGAESGAIL